jgi:hypothetical protein
MIYTNTCYAICRRTKHQPIVQLVTRSDTHTATWAGMRRPTVLSVEVMHSWISSSTNSIIQRLSIKIKPDNFLPEFGNKFQNKSLLPINTKPKCSENRCTDPIFLLYILH